MITKEDIINNRDKFFKKLIPLEDTDCITFQGHQDRNGYIQFQFNNNGIKKNIQAHRAAYILDKEEEISTDDIIMHSCDNPSCVNPIHLSKGTHQDNVQDRVNKGRSAIGINNGRYIHGNYCN